MIKNILATNGFAIEFLQATFEGSVTPGDYFARDPKIDPGRWRITKVFEGTEEQRVEALINLIGITGVKKLFKVELFTDSNLKIGQNLSRLATSLP